MKFQRRQIFSFLFSGDNHIIWRNLTSPLKFCNMFGIIQLRYNVEPKLKRHNVMLFYFNSYLGLFIWCNMNKECITHFFSNVLIPSSFNSIHILLQSKVVMNFVVELVILFHMGWMWAQGYKGFKFVTI